jgi:hypothetical protein
MDFGMDMSPGRTIPGYSRLELRERNRGRLNIRTPKVDAKTDKKWFGVPPTPLGTEKTFRTGGPIAF